MGRLMNSSIFTSEAAWRRVLRTYVLLTLMLGVAMGAAILATDPYDTGRFALLPARGVPDFGQRFAFASVGRESRAEGAIIGNSTIQLVDPERLSRESGLHFVSLAVPGTGPREQIAVADWFRRHHPGAPQLALVFGLDMSWCTHQSPIPLQYPFPFWLYSKDSLSYALNMMSYRGIEASVRKVAMLWGHARRAAPNGYHDYDTGHPWHGWVEAPADAVASDPPSPKGDFTAVPLLRQFLAKLGPNARIVLLMVPRYAGSLPQTDAEARALASCKAAYHAIADGRPNAVFLDFLVDSDMVRREENFWDTIHYRGTIARVLERQAAAALDEPHQPLP
jgi:hypothetical protein